MFRSSPLAESLSPFYPDIKITPPGSGAMHDRPQRKAPPAPIQIPASSPMLDGTPDPMPASNDIGGGISIPGLNINDQEVDGEIHVTWVSARGTSTVFVVAGPNAARLDGESATIVQKDGMLVNDVGDDQAKKSKKKSGIGYRGLVGGTARKVSYVPASMRAPSTSAKLEASDKGDNEGDNFASTEIQAKGGRITRSTARTKALFTKTSSKSRSAPATATTPSAESGSKSPSPQGSTRTRAFTRKMAATATTSPYFDKPHEKKSLPESTGPKDKGSNMGTKEKSKSKSKSKLTGTFPRARRDTFSPVSVYQTPKRLGSKGA